MFKKRSFSYMSDLVYDYFETEETDPAVWTKPLPEAYRYLEDDIPPFKFQPSVITASSVSSKYWKFRITGDIMPTCPNAFYSRVRYCIWICYQKSGYQPVIYGLCQFNTARHMDLLLRRYCKSADWSPVSMFNTNYITWFRTTKLFNAQRFEYGVPIHEDPKNQPSVSLPKATPFQDDLIEEYHLLHFDIRQDLPSEIPEGYFDPPSSLPVDPVLEGLSASDFDF